MLSEVSWRERDRHRILSLLGRITRHNREIINAQEPEKWHSGKRFASHAADLGETKV